jgi:hypothetical protein
MTKIEKVKILDENSIKWDINEKREIIALCKMSTPAGDDCSEWVSFDDMIDILKFKK